MALGRINVLKSAGFLKLAGVATYDHELANCLNQATKIVERAVGHQIEQGTHSNEHFRGRGAKFYYTRHWPLTSITNIWYAADSSLIPSTYYEIRDARYVYVLNSLSWQKSLTDTMTNDPYAGGWAYGVDYKITYIAGYDTSTWLTASDSDVFPVPANIEYAACDLAALLWMQGREDGGRRGISSINRGAESAGYERYVAGLPDSVKRIVEEYHDYNL